MEKTLSAETLGGITREQAHSEKFSLFDALALCDSEGFSLDELERWYRGAGCRYHDARRAAGLSGIDAAEALGCSLAALHSWESGKTEPSTDVLEAMRELYHWSEDRDRVEE